MLYLLAVAALAVVVLFAFVRWLEPRFAFFPAAGETATPADYGVPYSAHTIETSDGARLRVWRLDAPTPRAVVVYFHGNGANLSGWAPVVASIARRGYTVVAPDYRGYGLSTGRPTESGLYRDADAVLAFVEATRDRSLPLVYWGRSIGTAVAAYAASRQPPDRLVLESGFPDARTLIRSSPLLAALTVFASYRFPTASFLEGHRTPVLVIHGDRDSVVPYRFGVALHAAIQGPKAFVTVRGADHNDLQPPGAAEYWGPIERFIDTRQ